MKRSVRKWWGAGQRYSIVCGIFTGLFLASGHANQLAAQGNSPDADSMFRTLDVNKDGKLTKSEVGPNAKAMIDQIFRMGSKPENGSMTREEFQVVFDKHRAGSGNGTVPRNPGNRPNPPPGVRPEPREQDGFPPILQFLDTNDDRRLTRAELGRMLQAFDRLDTNQDGLLDAAELAAASQEPSHQNPTASPQRSTGGSPPARNAAGNPQGNSTRAPAVPEASAPGTSSRTGADTAASRLRGVWSGWVVRGRGENPNEGEMEIELTVEGNRIVGRELGTRRGPADGLGAGTFTMTGDGRTGNLDTVGTSGSQDGRNSMGIYELDGDTLKWCVTQRNRQRPRTMESDRGNYLLVLRKQASQK